MNSIIDTHCHIHMADYGLDGAKELLAAKKRGVETVIVIGQGAEDSQLAHDFARENAVSYSVGLHPHQADSYEVELPKIRDLIDKANHKPVAVGECGLDYYYMNAEKNNQKQALKQQLLLGKQLDLPLIFHIRGSKDDPKDAFIDFFEIYDEFSLAGVVHSFSADTSIAEMVLERELYVGLNGILTFTKDTEQITAAKKLPIDRILLETDAPFLTPQGFRGTINTPQYVVDTAQQISQLRGETFADFAKTTTENAKRLFRL